MKIEWMAHSCFKVTLENGKVIVFDPFDESIGYTRSDTAVDYVFISHDHKDHSCLDHLQGDYKVFRDGETVENDDISAIGIETLHGDNKGKNMTYRVTADGISLLHLGDLGDIPGEDYFEKLGHIDIMFVPVGGHSTLDAEKAFEVCKKVEPNLIIPMHFKTMFLELDLDPVFNFTDITKEYFDRSYLGASSFSITAATLKKRSRIMVMQCELEDRM